MNNSISKHPPFASHKERSYDIDLIIALVPVIVWACILFSPKVLILISVSAVSCALLDIILSFCMEKRVSKDILSSVITGIIISLTVSEDVPVWIPVLACAVALTAAKYQFVVFGKRGNVFSPAALGIVVCTLLSGASSYFIDCFRSGAMPTEGLFNTFIGNTEGAIGTVSAMLLLISGFYLMLRGAVPFRCVISATVTIAVLSLLVYPEWTTYTDNVAYQLLAGGTFFYIFFVASNKRNLPFTGIGRMIYGVAFAVILFFLRCYTQIPAPEAISVLAMNILTPVIDFFTRPIPFGGRIRKVK